MKTLFKLLALGAALLLADVAAAGNDPTTEWATLAHGVRFDRVSPTPPPNCTSTPNRICLIAVSPAPSPALALTLSGSGGTWATFPVGSGGGGGGGSGTVTSVGTGTGLTGGPIISSGTISLADTAVAAGSYGDATHAGVFTVDAQGRLTSANAVSISGLSESAVTNLVTDLAARALTSTTISAGTGLTGGGSLASNRTITLADTAVTPGTYTAANITVDQQGRITAAASGSGGGGGTVTSVGSGTGLTGGPITTSGSLSLANTAVAAGSYGDATHSGTFTVNAQGQLTAASSTAITGLAESAVTGLVSDLASKATDSLVVHLAGAETITGVKSFAAALRAERTAVADADKTTSATADMFVAYTSITAARTVTATVGGSTSAPLLLFVLDESGSASGTNTITLSPSSGHVDGATSKVIVNTGRGGWFGYCDGTDWHTIGFWISGVPALAARNISTGTGLSGGGDLTADRTLSIANTAVTSGSYGDASHVPNYTVNAQGQLTAAASTSIAIAESAVTNLTTDLAAKATDSLVVHLAGSETITGAKTFNDSLVKLNNSANTFATTLKSAATAARNWTFPDVSDTAVGQSRNVSTGNGLSGGGDLSADRTLTIDTSITVDKTTAQTLSSKTLTAPIINGLTSSGSTAIDFSGNSGAFKTSTGVMTIGGGLISARRGIADAAATITSADFIVAYTSITATRVATLPNANVGAGTQIYVGDESGSVTASIKINVQSAGGTVDGIAAGTGVNIAVARCFAGYESDGTNWHTIDGGNCYSGVNLVGQVVVNGLTASGSTSNDFSGSSATFKTSTGAVTLGGDTTVASGKKLSTDGIGSDASDQHTFPTGTDALCSVGATQTLTSKTLTSPVINGATSSGSTDFDLSGNSGNTKTTTGTTTVGGVALLSAAQRWERTTVADANKTTSATADFAIAYTSLSAARTITATTGGSAAAPLMLMVVDESGSASGTNTLTLSPSSGTIDGTSTKVVVSNARGGWLGYCDGTNWHTIGAFGGGGSGTVTSVATGTGLTGGTITTTGTLSVDQTFAPTWTGVHIWDKDSIGTAQTVEMTLENNTAAANNAQQFSPCLEMVGQGWKTNSTAASQTVKWCQQVRPVQGAANPTSELVYWKSVNGGAYSEVYKVTDSGTSNATVADSSISYATESANKVFAGPSSGGATAPTYRSLVAADLPNTAVTAGTYNFSTITVDAQGRLTAASAGTTCKTLRPETGEMLSSTFPQFDKALGTNFPIGKLRYDDTATESAYWTLRADDYGSGNFTAKINWYSETSQTTGAVVWGVSIAAIADGAAQSVETKAFDTEDTVTTTVNGTAKGLTASSLSVSHTNSAATGNTIFVKLRRVGSSGSDTMTGDADLITLQLCWATS